MKTNKIRTTVVAASAVVAIGFLGAPISAADDAATTATIGQQAKLVTGDIVQGWTISGLKPSADVIPYTPGGVLWEATATNEAIQGTVQPIVSNLNARTANGEDYRVLFGIATSQGVNPAALAQGEKTTGKVYFDVTGETPDRVVYNDGGDDLLLWEPAPPAATGAGTQWTPPSTGSVQSAPVRTAPAAPAATPPAPAPAATGSQGTPLPTGSQGTPLPAGTAATPAPATGSRARSQAPQPSRTRGRQRRYTDPSGCHARS